MEPRILTLEEKKLIGKRLKMSFASDKTIELWKSFSPRKKEITNTVNTDLFSVEIYNNPKIFSEFNPHFEFEKWAAVQVSDFEIIPEDMEPLVIPNGKYAVFHYKGKPSEAGQTFQYIYGIWLPNSGYEMDNRPCLAIMGENYKGEHPDSEEDFWVPVIEKNRITM